jgi:predicted dithiol-disulfide oxidoreductase (DUF899 family)
MTERSPMNLPPVASEEEWQAAREALLVKEKEATHARDALAAERRRLPMVRIEKDLHARDTLFALVSRGPFAKIAAYKDRMGWSVPWYSSFESDFNVDFRVGPDTPQPRVDQDGETFGLSVFLRDGDSVFAPTSRRLATSRLSAASGPFST